jgi:hypothetical protein
MPVNRLLRYPGNTLFSQHLELASKAGWALHKGIYLKKLASKAGWELHKCIWKSSPVWPDGRYLNIFI